ncbi:unnamed protein product [Somion occarium]|uniref:Enoyl reductase (ER) domain-containing protein n=1 Tax=Somion occarium TaxID=3059160 RepID=A0ABP1CRM6_9APHY
MSLPSKTAEYYIAKPEGIEHLTFREAPLAPPKSTEVLVKIHAVSLNYRDIAAVTGTYPGLKPEVVPCSDMAGEVIAVGSEVKDWKKGDRVTSNFCVDHLYGDVTKEILDSALGGPSDGTLTQYKNFPAHALLRVPEYLTYEETATLPCAAVTAWNALLGPVPLKGGDTVLVQGTGGVSIFALQIAAAMGATVIATSSSNEKLQLAKKLGATHLINYKEHPDWDQQVLKLTGGRGADHIIEIGGPGTLLKSISAARYAGWIHNIGFLAGVCVSHSPTSRKKGVTFRSILIGSRTQFEDMNRLFVARQIHPVVNKVFTFEQAQEAYQYLLSQKHVGKVVIKVAKD